MPFNFYHGAKFSSRELHHIIYRCSKLNRELKISCSQNSRNAQLPIMWIGKPSYSIPYTLIGNRMRNFSAHAKLFSSAP